MATAAELQIILAGTDEASGVMNNVQTRAEKMAKGFRIAGGVMTAAGGAIVGGLGLVVKDFAAAGDEVQKMALRTGFGTEALSELKYVAEISGASLGGIEKGTQKMSKTILGAERGLETYTRVFDELGINLAELKAQSPEEQFFTLASALGELEDQTEKVALAQEIFGRAGANLLPMFAESAEGIEALREKARDMGIVFDQDAANSAANLNDAMTTLTGTFDGVKIAIAEKLVPVLIPMIEQIQAVMEKVSDWTKKNPELTRAIVIATAAIGGILLVVGPLLMMLPLIASGIGMVSVAFNSAIWPVTLVVLAIAALVAGGILLWKNWDKIWGGIKETTETVVNSIIKAINTVIRAMNRINPLGNIAEIEPINLGTSTKKGAGGFGIEDFVIKDELKKRAGGFGIEDFAIQNELSKKKGAGGFGIEDLLTSLPNASALNNTPNPLNWAAADIVVNNNIAGSLLTEKELTEITRTGLLDIQDRNTTTGIE